MTSALFQRKGPLHPVPSFLRKKKIGVGWGIEEEKAEKHPYNPKFSQRHKGDFKDRHSGSFFMCNTGSVILSSLCFHGQLGSIPKLKNKRPHCSERSELLQEISSSLLGQINCLSRGYSESISSWAGSALLPPPTLVAHSSQEKL